MIIAVDFDGVLCVDDFPRIGTPKMHVIKAIKELSAAGHEVVLWTCRVEKQLEEALDWCAKVGVDFDAVNDNAPSNKAKYAGVYTNAPRKVYADIYVDDHGIGWDESSIVSSLKDMVWRYNHGYR